MAAGHALGRQFWKANPNQLALPGMEGHAHPGAPLLAEGYHFEHYVDPLGNHDLSAVNRKGEVASFLSWSGGGNRAVTGLGAHEIEGVHTRDQFQHKGIAGALYGIGRTMTGYKPRHSKDRTDEGNAWAKKVSVKYGGPVPKERYEK